MPALSSVDFLAILPEILILAIGLLVLILDPFWKAESRRLNLGWLTAGGLFATLAIVLMFGRPGDGVPALGGMVRFDWFAYAFKLFFIFAAAVTALLMMDIERLGVRAESYALLLAATLGMCLMAAAADLVMLYLALETTSIPLYVLAGFMLDDDKSTESGFKYLLYGAFTTTVLLYGFSLLYGLSGGKTSLGDLAGVFVTFSPLALGVLILVLVGIGFKISAVPFHFWAPDVYEGAPTPIAGFLSTASKAAGFAVLLRLFFAAFPALSANWALILAILATLSMTLGNFLALAQHNVKRLLAYSSIAHAGYALIGVVAYDATGGSQLGAASVIFYLFVYILTNLAAFGTVVAVGRAIGSDEYRDYAGLSRRSPYLALVMLAAFLSLAGMPPFGGFMGKVLVFAAGVQTGWTWLVVVGILNSIVGLYYYLNVMKYVYLYRLPGEDEASHPIPISRPYAIALAVLAVGVIVLGTVFAPWVNLSQLAAFNLF